jgi:hypothetical protein
MPPTRPGSPRACGPRDDGSVCHCEERSDVAIQGFAIAPGQATHLPWVAMGLTALAMTGNGTSLRGGKADVAIQRFTLAPGHAAHLPWIATGLPALAMTVPFVIGRRQSRRGNPGVYRSARPDRPPALVRHGPVGPRDDGSVCHCEEAKPTRQSPHAVIARRQSRRGNPVVCRSARPGRPPALVRHGPAGPRDDGSVCHCEEA